MVRAGVLIGAIVATAGACGLAVPAAAAAPSARPDVIVVGTPQLLWADLDASRTPNLWRLAGSSAMGSLSVKAADPVSCEDDGWLTVGAGNRATAEDRSGARCGTSAFGLDVVRSPGAAGTTAATVVGFAAARARNLHRSDDTHLGALADALESAGACVSAAGPAAALGAADSRGTVASYRADVLTATADPQFLSRCEVTMVAATAADVDQVVGLATANAPPGAEVIVVGVSEDDAQPAHLHVALAHGPSLGAGQLTSASTRRTPFVQLVDLAPTVLGLRGIAAPRSMIGQPWHASGGRTSRLTDEVSRLSRLDLAARQQAGAIVPFWVTLVALMLAACLLAAWTVRRRGKWRGHRLPGIAAVACAWCGLLPAASFVAGLVPWWDSSHPLLELALATAVAAGLATALSTVLYGKLWQRRPFGLAAAVGTITFAVIALDLVSGAHLQIFTMAGYSPLVAGRFAGIGNVGFGIFAAGALLGGAGWSAVTVRLPGEPERWHSPGIALAAAGVLAVVIDGAPPWGSDVGGVLALVPSFAVLGWLLTGVRISWWRLLGGAAATIGVIVAFALIDYSRPQIHQTHLGRFVGDVLHGGAWSIVRRKALADVHLLGYSVLTLLIPVMVAVAIWLLRLPPRPLRDAFSASAVLRPTLVALLVMAIVGAVVNDSGIVIPALAVLVVLPATMAVLVSVSAAPRTTGADEHDEAQPGLLP